MSANPTVELVDGIVRGNLNMSGSGSQKLRFQFLSSSKGGKLSMGTVKSGNPSVTAQSFTLLPYADWLDGSPRGIETFTVRVTPIASAGTAQSGPAAQSIDVSIPVNVGALAPKATPLAFTYKVAGYGGTGISANFFPAPGLTEGATAPVILQGSALGAPANTDPYQDFDTMSHTPSTATLRDGSASAGFNVVTWDPRGEFASGGVLQLNDPFIDGIDVKHVITWTAAHTPTTLNGPGDPALGMVGGSSSGEMQLVTAGIDPRVDAIAPATTWNSLIEALQPHGVLDTSVASRLLAAVTKPEVRLNAQLRAGLKSGIATGRLSDATLNQLADKNASTLLGQLQAPTLLWQSTSDPLFSIDQSMQTAESILDNPYGTPVKIAWFNGSDDRADTIRMVSDYTVAWMNKYVAGLPIPDSYIPDFQWWDQAGTRYTSPLLPMSPGFNGPEVISARSAGGRLPMGSSCSKPVSGLAMQADVPEGAQIVGTPSFLLTYRGRGKGQAICVRVTDASTGRLLSSPVSVLPLTLDGKQRTEAIRLNGLAFTGQSGSRLTVTVWGVPQVGITPASVRVPVSDIAVNFPVRAVQ